MSSQLNWDEDLREKVLGEGICSPCFPLGAVMPVTGIRSQPCIHLLRLRSVTSITPMQCGLESQKNGKKKLKRVELFRKQKQ